MSEIVGRKLSDRIITEGILVSSYKGFRDEPKFKAEEERLGRVIRKSPVFYIQAVDDYLADYLSENQRWGAEDLPCIAPPYPSFLMEFRLRPESGGYKGGFRKAGALFESARNPEPDPERMDPPQPMWRMKTTVLGEDQNNTAFALARYELHISKKGVLMNPETNRCQLLADILGAQHTLPESNKGRLLQNLMSDVIFPGLLAITFTHAKGTRVREEEPPVKLSKKHEKKTGQPLVKYNVIDINPLRQLLLQEGNAESEGLSRALHLVRGHFADYRDRGLFGKYKDIFWVPDHNRGTMEAGIVVKDYNIQQPDLST